MNTTSGCRTYIEELLFSISTIVDIQGEFIANLAATARTRNKRRRNRRSRYIAEITANQRKRLEALLEKNKLIIASITNTLSIPVSVPQTEE